MWSMVSPIEFISSQKIKLLSDTNHILPPPIQFPAPTAAPTQLPLPPPLPSQLLPKTIVKRKVASTKDEARLMKKGKKEGTRRFQIDKERKSRKIDCNMKKHI